MIVTAEPLLHHNAYKQCSQRKVNALCVESDDAAHYTAQRAAGNPVDMVKQGHKEVVFLPVLCRHILLVRADKGVGLVSKTEDKIGLHLAHVLIFIQK